jgi:hypothetical protein
MKKYLLIAIAALTLTACGRPVEESTYAEIKPDETAFLIPLDGASKDGQAKLDSVDYLEKNKVQAKRITLPTKAVDSCPGAMLARCWTLQPTMRLIAISRTPVSREWTSTKETGTTASNDSFHVESVESIDFKIGAQMTAHVEEADTAKFLYYYSGKTLAQVMDTNIRSLVGSSLSEAFGVLTLDNARAQKVAIFQSVGGKAKEAFAKRGITIDNFGFTEGMTYSDTSIQNAINKRFEADVLKGSADAAVIAANKFAQAKESIEAMQRVEQQKKLVDGQIEMMKKWNGVAPQVVTNDSMFAAMFKSQVSK